MPLRIEKERIAYGLISLSIALLLFSFYLAYQEFVSYRFESSQGMETAITSLLNLLTSLIPKIVWISLMVAIGFILLAKSVQILIGGSK